MENGGCKRNLGQLRLQLNSVRNFFRTSSKNSSSKSVTSARGYGATRCWSRSHLPHGCGGLGFDHSFKRLYPHCNEDKQAFISPLLKVVAFCACCYAFGTKNIAEPIGLLRAVDLPSIFLVSL